MKLLLKDRAARRIEEVVAVSGYDSRNGFKVEKIA